METYIRNIIVCTRVSISYTSCTSIVLYSQIDKDRPVLPADSAYIKMNRVYSYATHISATHYFIFADLRQYILLLSHKQFGHSNQTNGHTTGHRK
jgi:hypothetical protein